MPDAEPATLSDPLTGDDVVLHATLPSEGAIAALERAGRRGRLPGFARLGDGAFRIDCDSIPFEHEMRGSIEPTGANGPATGTTGAPGCRVTLRVRRKRLMPTIFAVTLIFTVWPGVWLTDSLIATYWSAYGRWTESMPWLTYAWYLPLAALPLPWVWKSLVTKSAAMARESARTQLASVWGELNTTPAE